MAKLLTPCRIHRQPDGVKLGKCANRAGHSQCPANTDTFTPNKTFIGMMATAWNLKPNLSPALISAGSRF